MSMTRRQALASVGAAALASSLAKPAIETLREATGIPVRQANLNSSARRFAPGSAVDTSVRRW